MTLRQQAAARNRKPLPPAHGACRWICQMTDAHAGVLTINGTVYTVQALREGYRLQKQDGTVYDLPLTLDSCDCPDSCYRHERSAGTCKHANGLRAALAALGYDVPAAPVPRLQTADAI
jgi:hypothetical protein